MTYEIMLLNKTDLTDDNVSPSTNTTAETPRYIFVMNVFAIAISLFTSGILAIGVTTLYKCTSLSFQIRRLSYNVLLSDIAFHMLTVALMVSVHIFGENYRDQTFFVRTLAMTMVNLISVASIAGLSLDRMVAVTKALHYKRIMTRKVINTMTLCIWLFHAVVPISFAISFGGFCTWDISPTHCDMQTLMLPSWFITAVLYAVYNADIICTCVLTTSALKKHLATPLGCGIEQRAVGERRFQRVTKLIVRISLTFVITNLPLSIYLMSLGFIPSMTSQVEVGGMFLGYIAMCCNSYLSIYFYVWKTRECKLIFLETFCNWRRNDDGAKIEDRFS